jgi:hypothetical protein
MSERVKEQIRSNQRRLTDALRQEIKIGQYKLCPFSPGTIWLENMMGEGMQCLESEVEDLLHEFFTEKF